MRPFALSLISGAASIAFAIASHTFATKNELSHSITPATFSNLLISLFFLIATLACLWICLSYTVLAYAQHTQHHNNILLTYATRLTTPSVRRALAGSIALSLTIAQPAYADEYDDTHDVSVIDIGWGSPELMDTATHSDSHSEDSNEEPISNPSIHTPDEIEPSSVPHNNPLTSTSDNTHISSDTTQFTPELPHYSPSSPTISPPATSPPATSLPATPLPGTHTVKSGDTLWDISKSYLPADATDSDIARACMAWSTANPTIKNPNLIYPTQQLTIPQEALS